MDEQNQTILIIDDAKENIVILRRVLKGQAQIIFAMNGLEGIEMAVKHRPDLILLDIAMPGISGFEVLTRLKSNVATADLPVIFVTGIPDTETEEKALSMGAVDYITKPFAPPVARARVRIQLQLRKLTKQLKAANIELTQMAMTDPLTGAFNRRHYMHMATVELQRVVRYQRPASMIILDIDRFKSINDRFGHDVGDRVLVRTAEACSGLLRSNDVFGRIGGEEFTALLPETDVAEASQIAERLREVLSTLTVSTPAGALTFTVSIGVTEFRKADQTSEEVLKRADLAMYQAKHNGRNQVVVFENGFDTVDSPV